MLLEVSSTPSQMILPGEAARLLSPRIPEQFHGHKKCLVFSMNVHGQHIGFVRVLDEYSRRVYEYQGSKTRNEFLKDWVAVTVDLSPVQKLFVLEATKGGVYESHAQGDICIDDLSVTQDDCRKYISFNGISYNVLYFSTLY